jgi:hypothetical protein
MEIEPKISDLQESILIHKILGSAINIMPSIISEKALRQFSA